MPALVLGPILRYVGKDSATVSVETDARCVVEVLGHEERTFRVEAHHLVDLHREQEEAERRDK